LKNLIGGSYELVKQKLIGWRVGNSGSTADFRGERIQNYGSQVSGSAPVAPCIICQRNQSNKRHRGLKFDCMALPSAGYHADSVLVILGKGAD